MPTKHGGSMSKKRQHPLRVTLSGDDKTLRTSEDVAYAWVKLGSHEGWTRVHNPDEHREAPRLLVPKLFDRALASVLLDAEPSDLIGTDLAGAVLLMPTDPTPEPADELIQFRAARVARTPHVPNDVTLARASTAEILDLVSEHDLSLAARALHLRSLPAREELLTHLGHRRVAALLAAHPELPEELVWQAMRSKGFDPTQVAADGDDAVGLAGNPNLSQEGQDSVIRKLGELAIEGDQTAEAPLARAVASPSLPECTANWLAARYEELPRSARLALARNEAADWLWLRRTLDSDLDPEIALASRKVGEIGLTRALAFAEHPDPGVRAESGEDLLDAHWSWDDDNHLEVLRLIDDPLATGDWSLAPDRIDATTWGAYSVARQWAARGNRYPEAEKTLRRLVDLHNRSWGAVGKGQGDPALAARADGARTIAQLSPELRILDLDPGRTYTLEEARLAMVQATAARSHADLREETSSLVQAVLDGCAAESEEHR